MAWTLVEHASADDMAANLAARVAGALDDAIGARGRAGLAVPGGTTPEGFLTDLGRAPIDWERVGVTLTDERWVPVSDPRSNQAMLARTLFRGPAAAAEFVPLYGATPEIADALPAIDRALERIVLPLDVAVLGMGEDMHTASLFPGALGLAEALDPATPHHAVQIRAPGAAELRVTLTARALRGAATVFLMIRGAAKRRALERAAAASDWSTAPVLAALTAPGRVEVHVSD